ncbi:hypothetical protein HZS_7271 [Henneguya salminicola]|nr:hypothetical protein HZS_7271 [Henneguya salminicola]
MNANECRVVEFSKAYSEENKLFYKIKKKELIYEMENISPSDIINVWIFKYGSDLYRRVFTNIDEAIEKGSFFVKYDGNTITVNPFNHELKYLVVEININDMFELGSQILISNDINIMVMNNQETRTYKFNISSTKDAEIISDIFHLTFNTIQLYNNFSVFSEIWRESVIMDDFELIMLAGHNNDFKYWFIAQISENYVNNTCQAKIMYLQVIDAKKGKIKDMIESDEFSYLNKQNRNESMQIFSSYLSKNHNSGNLKLLQSKKRKIIISICVTFGIIIFAIVGFLW